MGQFMPGQVLGIVGGGHQGRLLALAAKNLGLKVALLDPDKYCQAADLSDWHVLAEYSDDIGMVNLAEKAEWLTFCSNKIAVPSIEKLRPVIAIPQSSDLLELSGNRLLLKKYLEESNINITPYHVIGESADLDIAIDKIGLPAIIKPLKPINGETQSHVMMTLADIRNVVPLLASGPCLLESFVECETTLSVSILGNGTGEFEVFPVVANQYDETGAYHGTLVPAPVAIDVVVEAKRLAEQLALGLKLKGIMTIELFVTKFGVIYLNSMSHGPQSVTDYSLNVGQYSQYEGHLRGLFGWPLPAYHLTSRCVSLPIRQGKLEACLAQGDLTDNWFYHLDRLTDRKAEDIVGHINVVTDDLTTTLAQINETKIWETLDPVQGGN